MQKAKSRQKVKVKRIKKVIVKLIRTKAVTEKELDIVEAIIKTGSYGGAQKELRLPIGTIRATTFRIRMKYDHALKIVQEIKGFQTRLTKISRKKRYFTG